MSEFPRKLKNYVQRWSNESNMCKVNCLGTSKPRLCRQWVLRDGMRDASGPWNTALPILSDCAKSVKISEWKADPFGGPCPQKCRQVSRTHSLFCSCLAIQRIESILRASVICWCQSSRAHPHMQASTQAQETANSARQRHLESLSWSKFDASWHLLTSLDIS